MTTVGDVAGFLDRFAPAALAADWDNVGLLLGQRSQSVRRVLTCLTVTPESANEAIETSAQLIVSHHPVFFKAVRRLTDSSPEGHTCCCGWLALRALPSTVRTLPSTTAVTESMTRWPAGLAWKV